MAGRSDKVAREWRRSLMRKCVAMAILTIGLLGWVFIRYGSVAAARQHFAGLSLAVKQTAVSVDGAAGEQAVAMFKLQNVSSIPVTIHGAETQCRCVALEAFPITVKPQATRSLQIGVQISADEDRELVSEPIRLFTSPSGNPILLRVNVRITRRPQELDSLSPQPDELFSKVSKPQ